MMAVPMTTLQSHPDKEAAERLRQQIRQLILLRETGPKSAAWQAARSQLIWRLQAQLKRAEQQEA